MAKVDKNSTKRIPASYRITEELYGDAMQKCLWLSLENEKRVTLSGVIEELIAKWVKRKI